MRDDSKLHGIETERKLFQTEHPGWTKTANKMVEHGIGVDFFIAAPGGVYMDIATIGMKCEFYRTQPYANIDEVMSLHKPAARPISTRISIRHEIISNCH